MVEFDMANDVVRITCKGNPTELAVEVGMIAEQICSDMDSESKLMFSECLLWFSTNMHVKHEKLNT